MSAPAAPHAPAAPQPRVGVGALLVVDDCAGAAGAPLLVLVGERAGAHGAGRLALPGGHLDFGEASFGACAAREVREETGVALRAAAFVTVHTTNDPMPAEGRHYATIFTAALVSPAQAAAARNLEPDKCLGWSLAALGELARAPLRDRLFSPLARFLDEGGERRVRALRAELEEARAAAAAEAAAEEAAAQQGLAAVVAPA